MDIPAAPYGVEANVDVRNWKRPLAVDVGFFANCNPEFKDSWSMRYQARDSVNAGYAIVASLMHSLIVES